MTLRSISALEALLGLVSVHTNRAVCLSVLKNFELVERKIRKTFDFLRYFDNLTYKALSSIRFFYDGICIDWGLFFFEECDFFIIVILNHINIYWYIEEVIL